MSVSIASLRNSRVLIPSSILSFGSTGSGSRGSRLRNTQRRHSRQTLLQHFDIIRRCTTTGTLSVCFPHLSSTLARQQNMPGGACSISHAADSRTQQNANHLYETSAPGGAAGCLQTTIDRNSPSENLALECIGRTVS